MFTITSPAVVSRCVALVDDPDNRFRVAVATRQVHLFREIIPRTPRMRIDVASARGCVELLEWWKRSGLEMKWTHVAMDWASKNGHVDVLEWWKQSELEMEWTDSAVIWASQYGHIDVLECGNRAD